MGEQKRTLRWQNYTERADDPCDTWETCGTIHSCTQHSHLPGKASIISTRLHHSTVVTAEIVTKLLKFQLLYQQSRQKQSWTCHLYVILHVWTWQDSRAATELADISKKSCEGDVSSVPLLLDDWDLLDYVPGLADLNQSPWSAQRALLAAEKLRKPNLSIRAVLVLASTTQ